MKIKLKDRKSFVNYFLHPLLKVSNTAVTKIGEKSINSIVTSPDGSTVLYINYKNVESEGEAKANLGNIDRLIKIFNCLNDIDVIDLDHCGNHLRYKSDTVRFTYHLLDNSVIKSAAVNMEKLKALKYDTAFKLTRGAISKIIKGSTFAVDTNKIYFSTNERGLVASLTDRKQQNVDEVTFLIADKFAGKKIEQALPMKFETFRIISTIPFPEAVVKINTALNVFTLEINIDGVELIFVVSGLKHE